MNARTKIADPVRNLSAELEASQALIEQLQALAADDEEFLSDLIEGQTNVFEIIATIDRSELDDRIMITGLDAHIKKLQERKRKAEGRSEMKRALLASTLSKIGLRTHRTPLGTITISDKAPTAIVIQESDIPSRFWTDQAPKLDKAALNEALRLRYKAHAEAAQIADEAERVEALAAVGKLHPDIPGATLSNGGVTLTIRRA